MVFPSPQDTSLVNVLPYQDDTALEEEIERLRIEFIAFCKHKAQEAYLLAVKAFEQAARFKAAGELWIEISGLWNQCIALHIEINQEFEPEWLEMASLIKDCHTAAMNLEAYTPERDQIGKSIRFYLQTYLKNKGNNEECALVWGNEKKKFINV